MTRVEPAEEMVRMLEQQVKIQARPHPAIDDDIALASGLRTGNQAAFTQVVKIYEPQIHRFVQQLLGWSGSEVDDAVQETFVRAYLNRKKFRGDCLIRTWLIQIATNVGRSVQRKRWIRERAFGWLGRSSEAESDARVQPERDELAQQVQKAVGQLPQSQREVVVLYYLQEFCVVEICQALKLSEAAVNVRLHRGRHRLQALLKGIYP